MQIYRWGAFILIATPKDFVNIYVRDMHLVIKFDFRRATRMKDGVMKSVVKML